MLPERAKEAYRASLDVCGEKIKIRRYSGTGNSRSHVDSSEILARVSGYDLQEMVETVRQGDRKVIAYADSVENSGIQMPLTTSDKIVVRGKELAIVTIDDNSRRIGDELIAYEIQVRG